MEYYNLWRGYDLTSMILSTTGLLIQFMNYEWDTKNHYHVRDPVKWPDAMDDPQLAAYHTNFVRMIGLFLTLNASFFLIKRHQYKTLWKTEYFNKDVHTRTYYQYQETLGPIACQYEPPKKSMLSRYFLIELLLQTTCPIPFYDMYISLECKSGITVHYFLSEFMLAVMAMRGFYILRSYVNYTLYTDHYSKKLCQQHGFSANIRYTLKVQLEKEPEKTVSFLFILFVVYYSYLLRIFELPYYRLLDTDASLFRAMDSFFCAIYVSMITMTTVGYGDIAPSTPFGRGVAIMIAITGSFLMAVVLMVAT